MIGFCFELFERLGIDLDVDRTPADLAARGWRTLVDDSGFATVMTHPDDRGVVLRVSTRDDGHADYVGLLEAEAFGATAGYAPRIDAVAIAADGTYLVLMERLREAVIGDDDAWWLDYASACHMGGAGDERYDDVRDAFEASFPGYAAFAHAVRARAPDWIDGVNAANVMMGDSGQPVLIDPYCHEAVGLLDDMVEVYAAQIAA